MLKSASRARSPVGRTVSPGGAASSLPRCLPAMMRTQLRHLRRRAAAAAKLVGEHSLRYLLDGAALEEAKLERPVGEADQPRHLVAEMLEDAAHLAVAPLAQPDLEPGIAALLALKLGGDRPIGDGVDGDALGEAGQPVGLDEAVHPHPVAAQAARRRQVQPSGPRPITC